MLELALRSRCLFPALKPLMLSEMSLAICSKHLYCQIKQRLIRPCRPNQPQPNWQPCFAAAATATVSRTV